MELIRIDFEEKSKIFFKEKINKTSLVVTIGQFDGLHRGHMVLFEKTLAIGKEKGLKTAVLTFDPHPNYVLGKMDSLEYITPLEQKTDLLDKLGFDYMILVTFTKDVASLVPKDFVMNYLVDLNVIEVVVGFDFCFGLKGQGKAKDITLLSDNKIKTTIIPKVTYHDEKIGSSKVKSFIESGNVEEIKNWLGRYYQIKGQVVEGMHIGQKINIPTANIEIPEEFIKVKPGVYAVMVTFGQHEYSGIANIGHNPSFNFKEKSILEVHIIDFSENIYGKFIEVAFVKFLRPEVKFPTIKEFQKQIEYDKREAVEIIKSIKNQ